MKIVAALLCLSVSYAYNAEKPLEMKLDPKLKLLELSQDKNGLISSIIRGIVCVDNFCKCEDQENQAALKKFVTEFSQGNTVENGWTNKLLHHGIGEVPPIPPTLMGMAYSLFSGSADKDKLPKCFQEFPGAFRKIDYFHAGWKICKKLFHENTDNAHTVATGFSKIPFEQAELMAIDSVKIPDSLKNKVIKLSQQELTLYLKNKVITPTSVQHAGTDVHMLAMWGTLCYYTMRQNGQNIELQVEKQEAAVNNRSAVSYYSGGLSDSCSLI